MKKYLVLDVESVGLHGEGFAVGAIVINEKGEELANCLFACEPQFVYAGSDEDKEWVAKNVPHFDYSCSSPERVREQFWQFWTHWKQNEVIMVADCAWPVEARFLLQCIGDNRKQRNWEGPYPLHDLASILLTNGRNPVGKFPRLETELPEHNPLNDARQSARILLENLIH